jgi:hypothetical protein
MLGTRPRKTNDLQLFRSNLKGIRNVDDDLAVPLSELLRDGLVCGEWNGEKISSAPYAS